jgi:Tol biopolymer transport system component
VERDSFASGSKIGQYRIIDRIGVGGMGEVYLAEDTTLGREVALKILPEEFAHDPERRIRLEREARILASLNHPNVATLHGLKASGDRAILEMELVPGKTLAERIREGVMSMAEALPVLRQIACGLEAAHQRGIIHRDLKPANIKLLPDGRVKVLDFGVGKVYDPGNHAEDLTASISGDVTGRGWVLGTAPYMSPEQVRGQPLEPRTDIWSFGCVMFEVITGQLPFRKATAAETIAAILKDDPDWQAASDAPAPIQRLMRRCLQKDLNSRLRDITDARLEIEDTLNDSRGFLTAPQARPRRNISRGVVAVAAVAMVLMALIATAGWFYVNDNAVVLPNTARVAIPIPPGHQFAGGPAPVLALSPDGTRLVYAATAPGSRTQLFVRPLDRFEPTPIPGTAGATAPFFSPDGEWVGFHAGDALRRVALSGGAPLKIADVPSLAYASWSDDDIVLFSTAASDGIWRVPAAGGTPEQVTRPDPAANETQHAFPHVLPGGKNALITVTTAGTAHPALLALDTFKWRTLTQLTITGGARFVPPGYLLFAQSGGLVAVAIDPQTGDVRGRPIPLIERVDTALNGSLHLAVSRNGTLVFVPSEMAAPARSLMMVERDGRAQPLQGARTASYLHPRISPDARWIAVTLRGDAGSDVWVYDLQRGTRTRLTSDGASGFPIWTPDGRNVTYYSSAGRLWTLFTRAFDASGPAQPLLNMADSVAATPAVSALLPGTPPSLSGANPQFPMSWSGDGKVLAFTERKPSAERDIWILEAGSAPAPFLVTPFDESSPAFSDDGRFLAYVSDESGRPEVYVQPYPGPGGRWLLSTDGGTDPLWPAGGRELLYRSGDRIMAVPIQASIPFSAGVPTHVMDARFEGSAGARNFDATRDGRRFIAVRRDESETPLQFHAVFNWVAEIERRAGTVH